MKSYQADFLRFVVDNGILKFGEFTLKSGRISPYFFNAGLFNSGRKLAFLGRCYAQAVADSGCEFDVLFGPAYKGIPLVSATAVALAADHDIDMPYCFNRKEAKAHGEGGVLVGAELAGRVLLVDDVITAGTAVRESAELLDAAGARLAGIVVAMDRQERGQEQLSAIQEIEQSFGIQVINIISLSDIIEFLESSGEGLASHLGSVRTYRSQYGV